MQHILDQHQFLIKEFNVCILLWEELESLGSTHSVHVNKSGGVLCTVQWKQKEEVSVTVMHRVGVYHELTGLRNRNTL